jgi:hypothetical protein
VRKLRRYFLTFLKLNTIALLCANTEVIRENTLIDCKESEKAIGI